MECDLLFCIQLNNNEAHKKRKLYLILNIVKNRSTFFAVVFVYYLFKPIIYIDAFI